MLQVLGEGRAGGVDKKRRGARWVRARYRKAANVARSCELG